MLSSIIINLLYFSELMIVRDHGSLFCSYHFPLFLKHKYVNLYYKKGTIRRKNVRNFSLQKCCLTIKKIYLYLYRYIYIDIDIQLYIYIQFFFGNCKHYPKLQTQKNQYFWHTYFLSGFYFLMIILFFLATFSNS